jgi:hypothetical protein
VLGKGSLGAFQLVADLGWRQMRRIGVDKAIADSIDQRIRFAGKFRTE